MYCLDTNIVIGFFRGDKKIIDLLHENDGNLCITPITICELYRGAYASKRPDYDVAVVDNFLISVAIIEFNTISCKLYGHLYARLKRKGKLMQYPNCMIAAIAKAHDLVLVTRDKRDFAHADIHLEEW